MAKLLRLLAGVLGIVTITNTLSDAEFSEKIKETADLSAAEWVNRSCALHITEDCVHEKLAEYRSAKTLHYMQEVSVMEEELQRLSALKSNISFVDSVIGHTGQFFQKVNLIQELIDNDRVVNICEIGFNAGHSFLNYALTNKRARLLTFDLFESAYSSDAVQYMQRMFPDREMMFVMGDSSLSVPDFVRRTGGDEDKLCNFVFIDGGHAAEQLVHDVLNSRDLVHPDPARHLVLIDDLHDPDLLEAYLLLLQSGAIEEENFYENIQFTANMEWSTADLSSLHIQFSFPPVPSEDRRPLSSMATVKYTPLP